MPAPRVSIVSPGSAPQRLSVRWLPSGPGLKSRPRGQLTAHVTPIGAMRKRDRRSRRRGTARHGAPLATAPNTGGPVDRPVECTGRRPRTPERRRRQRCPRIDPRRVRWVSL